MCLWSKGELTPISTCVSHLTLAAVDLGRCHRELLASGGHQVQRTHCQVPQAEGGVHSQDSPSALTLSTGGKLSSTDININIKVQLQTIILSQWHTSLSQMGGINLISQGCLRSGLQARGHRAFLGKSKLTVTSLTCSCRVVRASPWLDLKACLPWERGLFMCAELYGFNKKSKDHPVFPLSP